MSFQIHIYYVHSLENDDDNGNRDSRKKRRRILGPEFGSIDLDSEEGKKLLAAKSQHMGAVLVVSDANSETDQSEFENDMGSAPTLQHACAQVG